MIHLQRINDGDKADLCKNVYGDIVQTSNTFLQCDEIGKTIRVHIPPQCYTNFRDALFHFRRLCKCNEWNECLRQATSIREHLNRAKTDALVGGLTYALELSSIILGLYEESLEDSISTRLRHFRDQMDDMIVNLRINGIMLDNAKFYGSTENDYVELMMEYCSLIYDNELAIELRESVSEHRRIHPEYACFDHDNK